MTPHAQIMIQNTPLTDVASLRKAIAVDPNLLLKDINEAVSNAQRISSEFSLAHAMTVVEYPQFKYWLQSNSSNVLLVNGHMQLSHEQEATSPLTVVSWVLHGILAANNDALPLFHLCGQHIHPGDPYWGLAGTLHCLNAQLLSANPESVNTITLDDNFIHNLESRDINTLCQLLHILVPRSSKKAVFILIDGFTIAEGSTSHANINILFQVLGVLVNQLNSNRLQNLPGPVVKVLITTVSASLYLAPLLYGWKDAYVLDLLQTGPVGGDGMNMFQDFSGYI